MTADSSCNVPGCDHTRPEECEVVRCATCNEPYDGTEAPAAHIARAHLDILARERRAARVRTQAERDGDDHTWRPGACCDGHPERTVTRLNILLRRPLPPVPGCCYPPDAVDLPVEALRMFDPQTMSGTRYAETLRAAFAESAATGKPVLLADGSAEVSAYQPRRRWWHRLTRRNP